MKLLSKYVDDKSLKQYYNSYILPIIDYCCITWGQCNIVDGERICKLQKRAARIILKCNMYTPSNEMFKKLNWMPFHKRVQYHTCILTYKSLNGMAPSYMSDLLKNVSSVHSRNLRSVSNNTLHIPRSKTKKHESSFSVLAPRLWNSLPIHIRESSTLSAFKSRLQQYFLSQD